MRRWGDFPRGPLDGFLWRLQGLAAEHRLRRQAACNAGNCAGENKRDPNHGHVRVLGQPQTAPAPAAPAAPAAKSFDDIREFRNAANHDQSYARERENNYGKDPADTCTADRMANQPRDAPDRPPNHGRYKRNKCKRVRLHLTLRSHKQGNGPTDRASDGPNGGAMDG